MNLKRRKLRNLEASYKKPGRNGRELSACSRRSSSRSELPAAPTADCGHDSILLCKCGKPMELEIEDRITVRLKCATGHSRYFFRTDNGAWESDKDRQKRMAHYRVCEECGAEFQMKDHEEHTSHFKVVNRLCPACSETILGLQHSVKSGAAIIERKNPNSPWRKWLNRAKPQIQARL